VPCLVYRFSNLKRVHKRTYRNPVRRAMKNIGEMCVKYLGKIDYKNNNNNNNNNNYELYNDIMSK